ncbi:hypothetical protein GCM10010840_06940 [Deinococcus aerolatus]|uniref:Uncharacterized protein n=1 Tax=Deinococcus aerolatus TaxID=522487 RepID=A0ABQ2G2E3_9DEIO|nr:hypothetical protein [Deinococcus aerolatus]GGL71422.1 hypothetical protein GCM10010840_06940 [Deinococcus aerolatus]
MGEAKRRKALGLMPTVHPFEAQLEASGEVTLVRGPDDAGLTQTIVDALRATQSNGPAWASEYRTSLLLSGAYHATLATLEDVEAVPVPGLRRITGELALGPQQMSSEQVSIPVDGGAIRLREQRHSFDGTRWETLGAPRSPQQVMSVLQSNAAFSLQGESIGQFVAEHWQAGRIDIEPDPPAEMLEALEEVVREWDGETEALWAELHRERMEDRAAPVPLVRRSTFELRRPAPLQNPLGGVFAIRSGVEFIPMMEADAYSLDGETWASYADPDAEVDGTHLPPELANIFDMEMVGVTVHADGRMEWGEDVPEEHKERIQTELREATGAGNAEEWAEWTTQMLRETYGDELTVLEAQTLPVPVAVRLDLPEDALGDPDPLSQTFMESEVTFDGEQWRDLFDDVPPELAAFLAPAADGSGEAQLN